jgi:beta-carotene hydroxylase
MSSATRRLTVPRELIGAQGDFNPTVLTFLFAIALTAVSTTGFFAWDWWPNWLSFVCNFVALHVVGTVIHDACHNAAHPNRIVNAILGHGSAFLLFFSFPVFTRVHMQHHANVNDPKNDPDHIVSTWGPLWFINARFMYHEIYFFQRRLWRKNELWEWLIARAVAAMLIVAAFQFGYTDYLFNYWFVPLAGVGLLLGLFFDYLPHRPFKQRNRWLNARIYPSWLLNILIGGQNYHLVHHLWPTVPSYNYQQAYYAMKPLLDAKGSPQSLGILESEQDFWGFVYDIFVGIRWHRDPETESQRSQRPQLLDHGVVDQFLQEEERLHWVGAPVSITANITPANITPSITPKNISELAIAERDDEVRAA